MSNKKIFTVLSVVVALFVIGSIVYFIQSKKVETSNTNEDEQIINELNSLLTEGAGIPDIDAPSANPLDKVAPSGNPVEKTNPFNNENSYENPFE